MPLSEQIQNLIKEATGYELETFSFYLGRFAGNENIPLEDLLIALTQISEEVKMSHRYGLFEREKEDELMNMAATGVGEDKMRKYIDVSARELLEMGLAAGTNEAVNVLTKFVEHMEVFLQDILEDRKD